jgi:hypothetical protein
MEEPRGQREDTEAGQPSDAEERRYPGAGPENAPGDLDSMGLDKRRQVVGQQYGASVRKQLTVYGVFLAVVVVLAIVFLTVVSNIDNREIPLEDSAPWTEATASQEAPRDIDFPRNGPQDTIPENEIGKAVPPEESDSVSGG